ncbi:MAG TPA: NAD-dependent epimerase/dehydratase family protein, partial [Legionellaceae bacterium]|nr:NAD-dependent epimerase/dehydratase family protein [Legionellaceae bacterium]
SKAIGEFYVRFFAERHQISALILRVFNTYGPRMVGTRYGQVIPEFIQKIHFDKTFTILGDGKQTRCFCYISDLIGIMQTLIKEQQTGIINVGNDQEITILDLAQTLHLLCKKPFQPVFLPPRPYDHQRRQPNIGNLRHILPVLRFTTLIDGLKKTLLANEKTK